MSDKYEQARRKLDELYHYKAIYPAQVGYRDRVVKEYLRSQFPEPAKIEGEEPGYSIKAGLDNLDEQIEARIKAEKALENYLSVRGET